MSLRASRSLAAPVALAALAAASEDVHGADSRLRVAKSVTRIQAELGPAGANWTLLLPGPSGHAMIRDDQLDLTARRIRDRGAK